MEIPLKDLGGLSQAEKDLLIKMGVTPKLDKTALPNTLKEYYLRTIMTCSLCGSIRIEKFLMRKSDLRSNALVSQRFKDTIPEKAKIVTENHELLVCPKCEEFLKGLPKSILVYMILQSKKVNL